MKIVEIIPNLIAGGAETFVVNLCNEMVKRSNVDLTLLTFYETGQPHFLKDRLDSRITLETIPKKPGIDVWLTVRLYRYIRKNRFDVAHFHINAIAYGVFPAFFYRKCRYYATIHNDATKESCGIHRLTRKVIFRLNKMAPITISDRSEQSFKQLYKLPSHLIYNGVPPYSGNGGTLNLNQFKRTGSTTIFVSAAAIYPVKNEVAVAKAFNRLQADAVILFLGKEADREYADALREQESPYVHYLGEVSNPVDYMFHSDFFILASHYEGLPISLLEAVSAGCIPVVTPVGGCSDVVKDSYNGFIIPTPDEKDIYRTIKSLCNCKREQIAAIKRNMAIDAHKYTIGHCAKMHLSLFERK